MITIFNRKELFVTFSMHALSQVRDALDAEGIAHHIRTLNLTSPTAYNDMRAGLGSFGSDMDSSYEYKVYVHKRDHEKARAVIGRA